jgi:hypothetical protein
MLAVISQSPVPSTYLGGLVLGRGNKVRPVGCPLEIGNWLLLALPPAHYHRLRTLHVWLVHVVVAAQQLSGLAVPLCNRTVLVSRDDVLGQVAEACDSSLALVAHDPQDLLVALLRLRVRVDLIHDNGGQVTGALLSHTEQLSAVGGELAALDRCVELPGVQQLSGLDVP